MIKFLAREISKIKSCKNWIAIARQAGFPTPNMLSITKTGESKLQLERVVALAKALERDPALLFKLALEQQREEDKREAIDRIFRGIVTENEGLGCT